MSCRHHLWLEQTHAGSIKFYRPDVPLEQMTETCALDVAARGEHTLEQIGDIFGTTREYIRLVERSGVRKLGPALEDWKKDR